MTTSGLTLSALCQYNLYYTIKLHQDKSLDFHINNQAATYSIPIIIQDMAPYIFLPVYNICSENTIHISEVLIEFRNNRDEHLSTEDCSTIASINQTNTTKFHPVPLPSSPNIDPFHWPILGPNGQVNIGNVQEIQNNILDTYPNTFFKPYISAIFHVDSGANVHATNDKRDFLIFHPIKTTINLAVGSKACCEGIGTILTKLTPHAPPIILAPVYYCPNGTISTISPSAIKLYNQYLNVTIQIHKSLDFQWIDHEPSNSLPMTVHNNLDYIRLPILHLSSDAINQPTLANLFQHGNNEQLIHQKFDHRSVDMIIQMQKQNMMQGMPTNIKKFHPDYKCPIFLLTNATKVPQVKHREKDHYKPGKFFCLDYFFWNTISIRGFSSILTAICMKTRYSFTFPTRNKRPPLATIAWFIKTLRQQGYPVLYV